MPYLRSILISFLLLMLLIHDGATQNPDVTNDSIQARKDLIDIGRQVLKLDKKQRKNENEKKVFFSLMPASGGSSENGVTLSSVNAAFYLGEPKNTNLSNIAFYPTTNFASYFRFIVTPNLWLSRNSWNILGRFEYAYRNQDTYGLGTNTSEDSLNIINYNTFRIYLSINREIFNNVFFGVGYSFDNLYNIEEGWDKSYPSEFAKYGIGTSGTAFSSGLSFNLYYDSRKNAINSLSGFYSSVSFRINSDVLGSNFEWQSIYFDTRKYISFSRIRHKTLAFRTLYWVTWGEVPYLNLPATGLDYSGWTGRGYFKGRYQGKQMLYSEAEYRFDITNNGLWGGVVFANAQSFTEPVTEKFEYIKSAVGIGGRLKFNKYSDSNMTCDIAFGKGSFNWYVSLNEAF